MSRKDLEEWADDHGEDPREEQYLFDHPEPQINDDEEKEVPLKFTPAFFHAVLENILFHIPISIKIQQIKGA